MAKKTTPLKYRRVAVLPDTSRKIDEIASRTKLKHVHVVGNAVDAYLEKEAKTAQQPAPSGA